MSGTHVVVGVDATDESLAAVDFAAIEAQLRGLPLHIVHATEESYTGARVNGAAVTLEVACQRAAVPAREIIGEIIGGQPASVLAEAAADAAILVVGRRTGRLARLRSTSVVAQIAAKAPCPVIVVQGVSKPRTKILVGVGTSESTQPALALAFVEARLRETDVTAIHAWRSPVLASHGVAGGVGFANEFENNADAARVLGEALAGWCSIYPDVQVHRSVPEGSPVDALVHASTYAQMVVVGIPRFGIRPSIMAHELIRRAMCPVAIVPADHEATGPDDDGARYDH